MKNSVDMHYNILDVDYCLNKIEQSIPSLDNISYFTNNLMLNLERIIIREPSKGTDEAVFCLNKCKEFSRSIEKRINEIQDGQLSNPEDDTGLKDADRQSPILIDIQVMLAQNEIIKLLGSYHPNLDTDLLEQRIHEEGKFFLTEKSSHKGEKPANKTTLEFIKLFNTPYNTEGKINDLIDRISGFLTADNIHKYKIPLRVYTDLFDFLRMKGIVKHVEGVRRTEKLIAFYAGFGKKVSKTKADADDVYTVVRSVTGEVDVRNMKLKTHFERALLGW